MRVRVTRVRRVFVACVAARKSCNEAFAASAAVVCYVVVYVVVVFSFSFCRAARLCALVFSLRGILLLAFFLVFVVVLSWLVQAKETEMRVMTGRRDKRNRSSFK